MTFKEKINNNKIPKHIAIIMDGNGRWAEQKGMHRTFGHEQGVESVRKVIEGAAEIGVKFLTLYAFSTENWNRPKEEVDMLMELMVHSIEKESDALINNNIRIMAIGDLQRLHHNTLNQLNNIIERSKKCDGLTVVIALSYSSRWEITEAMKKIAQKVKNSEIQVEDISEKTISENLTTSFMPDPELIIRTSGEQRLSNFLMWQASYSEFAFVSTLWPDYNKESLFETIYDFQHRERRFGKTSKQIQDEQ